ncbi:T9SS type A sorting domain-containing protein [Lentimicrobium sp. S6]|uniref:T9SS type A sorting domain-containing protein n=1 Tax=Lentimicrobium sp. S6 TaxID=2735872 RepID=UPI001553372C|nr:T9SS type A sorting domain-containing protein [Lentimicrobium sp. S6]NPD45844.1 T9SS type A sorting domain-containing protein [Lentimicrobium sp. S6]
MKTRYIILTILLAFFVSFSAFAKDKRAPIINVQTSGHADAEDNSNLWNFMLYNGVTYGIRQWTNDGDFLLDIHSLNSDLSMNDMYSNKLSDSEGVIYQRSCAAFWGFDDKLFCISKNNSKFYLKYYDLNTEKMHSIEITSSLKYNNSDYYYTAAYVWGSKVILAASDKKGNSWISEYNFDNINIDLVFNRDLDYGIDTKERWITSIEIARYNSKNILIFGVQKSSTCRAFNRDITNLNLSEDANMFLNYVGGRNVKVGTGSIQSNGQLIDSKPTNPNRVWAFWAEDDDHNDDGLYKNRIDIMFLEYYFTGEEGLGQLTENVQYMNLSSEDYYNKHGKNTVLNVSYFPKPLDCIKNDINLEGDDSFQKRILVINTTKDKTLGYSYFNSDIYTIHAEAHSAYTDFSQLDDEEGRKFWILAGITDGAPPAPIDWDVWDTIYPVKTQPTSLELEFSNTEEKSLSIKGENTYTNTIEAGLAYEGKLVIQKAELLPGGSWTQTNEKMNYKSKEFTSIVKQTQELDEINQESSYYMYYIPALKRYSFMMFPWWDADIYTTPINEDTTYMFRNTGYTVHFELGRPLNEAPHYIDSPNDPSMMDWMNRDSVAYFGQLYGAQLNNVLEWSGPGTSGGQLAIESSFEDEIENTSSHSASFTFKAEMTVFHIKGVYDFEGETKMTTQYTSKYALSSSTSWSMENISEEGIGVNCNSLQTRVYMFRANEDYGDYWYYDDFLEGTNDRPFYIAYEVTNVTMEKSAISTFFPKNDENFVEEDMINFKWLGDFDEYSIAIFNSNETHPSTLVYRTDFASKTSFSKPDLAPGVYYWKVIGRLSEGGYKSTELKSFTILDEKEADFDENPMVSKIRTNVSPNPNSQGYVRFNYELLNDSPVNIRLYNSLGQIIWENNLGSQQAGLYEEIIPLEQKKAICFLKIETNHGSGIEKIIVR